MIRYDNKNLIIQTQRISKSLPYYYALFGANGLSPIYPVNAINCASLANVSNTQNVLYALPFISAPRETNLIGMQFTVQTASAGNSGMMGLYENTGHAILYPSGLIFKSNPLSLTTTGAKLADTNIILTPGTVYWTVYTANTNTSIRNVPLAAMSPMLGFDESFYPASHVGFRISRTFDSNLPSIFPTGATPLSTVNTVTSVAAIGLRFGY